MNRIASLVAGTITTALVSASIAAVSASQGILPIFDKPVEAEASWPDPADEAQVEWPEVSAADIAMEPAPAAIPAIVYVDKPPIVVTEQVIVPASPAPSVAGARSETPAQDPATQTASARLSNSEPPTPSQPQAPAFVNPPTSSPDRSAPSPAPGPSVAAIEPSLASPTSTPPAAPTPTAVESASESWTGDDDADDDEDEDSRDEDAEDREEDEGEER